jgi:hypothetical protein
VGEGERGVGGRLPSARAPACMAPRSCPPSSQEKEDDAPLVKVLGPAPPQTGERRGGCISTDGCENGKGGCIVIRSPVGVRPSPSDDIFLAKRRAAVWRAATIYNKRWAGRASYITTNYSYEKTAQKPLSPESSLCLTHRCHRANNLRSP